jgi:hypothetical protein
MSLDGQFCGFWMTPSSVMYVELMILRNLVSFAWCASRCPTRPRQIRSAGGEKS